MKSSSLQRIELKCPRCGKSMKVVSVGLKKEDFHIRACRGHLGYFNQVWLDHIVEVNPKVIRKSKKDSPQGQAPDWHLEGGQISRDYSSSTCDMPAPWLSGSSR